MSVATLSKLENGKRSLAYDKLVALSRALGVDISRLFSTSELVAQDSQAPGRRSVQRKGEGDVVEAGPYSYTYLAQDLSRKRLVPLIMDLRAHNLDEFGELLRHDGEEHVLVLEGEVTVISEIYAPLHLTTGDSIYLDSRAGHAYLNAGEGAARIFCTASSASPIPDGE
jgi:transcriptional regulator with XRE-family HTH domain